MGSVIIKAVVTSALCVASFLGSTSAVAQDRPEKPNVVVMLVDNVGWGEIGAYGGGVLRGAETPRLDAFAREGTRLLNYNVEPQCTPSRSALLTGRHPIRSGTTKVVWGLPYGLVNWEITMAELFSGAGYRTGMFGKWHLGDKKGRFPTDQGFDRWYGIPNTTDEAQYTSQLGYDPAIVETPHIVQAIRNAQPQNVMEYTLETRPLIDSQLANEAIDFMTEAVDADEPFFVYLPFTQAHLPALPHPDFDGVTGNGRWADMLTEMDFRAGQILDSLDDLGVAENTLVIWTSDNGPEESPTHFGTAGYWRGFYFTTLEGSLRAPFLIRWPGQIPAGRVSDEIVHTVDLMPTLARVAGYSVPNDRVIDGVDQWDFLTGASAVSRREGFPAYNGERLQSYKWRNFKLHYWQQDSMFDTPVQHNVPRVHNLMRDPKELFGVDGGAATTGAQNLTWVYPAVTERVLKFQRSLIDEPPVPFPAPFGWTPGDNE